MEYRIERIDACAYPLFEDMVYWRVNGMERVHTSGRTTEIALEQLNDPNLYVYAVRVGGRYVGWISLVYIPKIGSRWKGRGHVYVDELWVAQEYRCKGLGKALLQKADELKADLNAAGIRLYVQVQNPAARALYESCGYQNAGETVFMEKS